MSQTAEQRRRAANRSMLRLKFSRAQNSMNDRKIENNSLSHCGFSEHEKPTFDVDNDEYEKQLAYWTPYIKRLIAKATNVADRRSELEQCARIAVWNAMATHGEKLREGFVYEAIKGTIIDENAKDERQTSFVMNSRAGRVYRKAIEQLTKELKRQPSRAEIADRVGVDVRFVDQYLASYGYGFDKHSQLPELRAWRHWSYFDYRRRNLEDRLIHVIDQQWIVGIYNRTTGAMREGLDAFMSDMSVAEWARRHNRKRSTIDDSLRRSIAMYRALRDIRFKFNDPIDPLEAIRRKGISVNSYRGKA